MATAGLTYKVDGFCLDEGVERIIKKVGLCPEDIETYLHEIVESPSKKSLDYIFKTISVSREKIKIAKEKIGELYERLNDAKAEYEESDVLPCTITSILDSEKKLKHLESQIDVVEKYIVKAERVLLEYIPDIENRITAVNSEKKRVLLKKKEEKQKIDKVEEVGKKFKEFLDTLYSNLAIGVGSGAVTYECIKYLPLSENHKALLSILASTAAITLLVPGLSMLVDRCVESYENRKQASIIEDWKQYKNFETKQRKEIHKKVEELSDHLKQVYEKTLAEADQSEKDGEPITL
jgi:endonuclease III